MAVINKSQQDYSSAAEIVNPLANSGLSNRLSSFKGSLYFRVSIVFWTLLFLLAYSQFALLKYLWFKAYDEKLQRVNWDIAESYAHLLREDLAYSRAPDQIRIKIRRLLDLNPEIDLYLLDLEGNLLPDYVPYNVRKSSQVDTKALEEFLNFSQSRKLPIYANDPVFGFEDCVFSVARVPLGEKRAYLYIVLNGFNEVYFLKAMEHYYLIVGGLLTTGVLTLIAAFIGSILLFYLTKRFHTLALVVHRIAAGDLQQRVPSRGSDEIAQLGREINLMADTIEENIEALEQRDLLRRELIANVSHDLRRPLSHINGYTETIINQKDTLSAEQQQNFQKIILKSAQSLNRLLEELFELSKLETEKIKPEFVAFPILDLIEDIVVCFSPRADEKHISLEFEHPDQVPAVIADFLMIERVITNIVDNALRFTPEFGKIRLSVSVVETGVRIEISDTGSGIPTQDIPMIFDRFYQSEERLPGTKGSFGLGLAIVKQIIELHKSQIIVQSTEGQGTIFSFILSTAPLE